LSIDDYRRIDNHRSGRQHDSRLELLDPLNLTLCSTTPTRLSLREELGRRHLNVKTFKPVTQHHGVISIQSNAAAVLSGRIFPGKRTQLKSNVH
jgi:hypothetical protein